jgi:PIN domain nuclease of toxin-antitoxin system
LSALLLDTHVVLWALGDVQNLSPAAGDALADGSIPAYVSAASIWEISIKRAAGKLKAPDDLLAQIADASFDSLPIDQEHADIAGGLPLHHRDPFDRMLVAQARCEQLTVVTRDERIAAYGVPVLW